MRLAAVAAAILVLLPLPAWAAPWIEGVWKGNYECAQGPTEVTLTLKAHPDGVLWASFQFYQDDIYGSFRMKGAFTEAGELTLEPHLWITRPEGWDMVGLAGQGFNRRDEGLPDTLEGEVVAEGCSGFVVTRQ
ncbi:MAG TPA: hypothetical protein VEA44_06200 [Caulobacter sp.]|nr:hypothetical protein [Caulobacter sp.]